MQQCSIRIVYAEQTEFLVLSKTQLWQMQYKMDAVWLGCLVGLALCALSSGSLQGPPLHGKT